jgi:hypothetical protein
MQKIRVVQQWQYTGPVPAPLLDDRALKQCADLGIDSLQSYVLWSEIEKTPGEVDFSSYDALTERLSQYDLKWTPFFILGPYYATPRWFLDSPQSVFAQCLEHGRSSLIQSIWNPYLPARVERFLQILAEHYRDSGVIDSVLLGISGNWGESIFPANGCFIGGFHTHQGWWCGDQYARTDFTSVMLEKYGSLDELNAAWGTRFSALNEICFPHVGTNSQWLRYLLGFLWQYQPRWLKSKIVLARSGFLKKTQKKDEKTTRKWLDFVDWYMGSMTNLAEFWLKTARRCFPNVPVNLVTGGNGGPRLGADFTAQAKLAARYQAGIRITNQTDDYLSSFVLTRLMSSACRFYGADYSTEEAAINSDTGIVMRIFDAATSGAASIYFKRLIGLGYDKYTRTFVPAGEPASSAVNFKDNLRYLQQRRPMVDMAVFYPSRAIKIQAAMQQPFFHFLMRLREAFDFDLIDERMVTDEALAAYRFFVLRGDTLAGDTICSTIRSWIQAGGILMLAPDSSYSWSILEQSLVAKLVFADSGGKVYQIGNGYVGLPERFENGITFLSEAYFNQNGKFPWLSAQDPVVKRKGVFYGCAADDCLYYDSRKHSIRLESSQKKSETAGPNGDA